MKRLSLLLLAAPLIFSCAARPAPEFLAGTLIDLTHPYDEATIFWPTADGFRLEKSFEGVTDKGYYYAANQFSMAEHGGTHIDAPVHFAAGRHTVDQIPLRQLIGRAVVVDVSAQCADNSDYQISVDDFRRWEEANGMIAPGSIVLLRTGYGKYWPDRKRYLGTDERGAEAIAKLRFPGLHAEGARWLAAHRAPKAVGLDTPSIDYGQSIHFESHRILFEKQIPAFENLANLDQLPLKDFSFIALPMKIRGGSGGPVRAVAVIDADTR